MRSRGFSLIELVITIALIAILLSMATLAFNEYNRKALIEAQVKSLYSDIIKVRTEAMFKRSTRSVRLTTTLFSVYSSATITANPVFARTLKYPLSSSTSFPVTVIFNERGLTTAATNTSICASLGSNKASFDSIVIGTVRTQMGKSNGTCDDANITPK